MEAVTGVSGGTRLVWECEYTCRHICIFTPLGTGSFEKPGASDAGRRVSLGWLHGALHLAALVQACRVFHAAAHTRDCRLFGLRTTLLLHGTLDCLSQIPWCLVGAGSEEEPARDLQHTTVSVTRECVGAYARGWRGQRMTGKVRSQKALMEHRTWTWGAVPR